MGRDCAQGQLAPDENSGRSYCQNFNFPPHFCIINNLITIDFSSL